MARTFTIRNQSNTKSVNLVPAALTGVMGQRGGLGPTRVPQEVLRGGKLAESYRLVAVGTSHDTVAASIQDLYDLLLQAALFDEDSWQNDPVYIVQQGDSETNVRYARVVTWLDYEYPNLYGNPFSQSNILDPLIVSIVRTHPWSSQPIGTLGTAITLKESDGPAAPTKVHVANFRDDVLVTHFKQSDGGAFTDLVAGSTLFPIGAALTTGDYIEWGSTDQPLKVIVIPKLGTAGVLTTSTLVLNYYVAAWTALVLGTDYTCYPGPTLKDCFEQNTEDIVISIKMPDDAALFIENAVNAYWIQLEETHAGPAYATNPVMHATETAYAQKNNYVEIPAASIKGDSSPIANIRLWTPAGGDEDTTFANLSRILIGAKSEHGNVDLDDFEPFLNAGNVDNPGACTLTYGDDSSSVADTEAPGGFHGYCDFGVTETMAKRVTFELDDLLPSYDGEYRLLVGVQQIGGDAGDVITKGRTYVGGVGDSDPHTDTRKKKTRGVSNGIEVLDLGFVRYPLSRAYYADSLASTDIAVEILMERITGTAVMRIYFAYLLPVSEGAVGVDDPVTDTATGSSALRGGNVIDIDAGMVADRNQKYMVVGSALVPAQEWGRFNRPIEFKNRAVRTRLYFLMLHFAEGNSWNTEPLIATPGCHLACEIFMSYRYATLRGAD